MKIEQKMSNTVVICNCWYFSNKINALQEKIKGIRFISYKKSKEKDASNMHFEGRNVKILEVMECHRHALQDLPTYTSAFPKLASALRGF